MVSELDALADTLRVLAARLDELDDEALDAAVRALAGLRARLDAAWVAAVGLADRRALHRRHASRDTATWLAGVTGERPGSARRDVELADALDAAPVVADAFAGGLSKVKAAELVRAAPLPADTQAELVALAHQAPVAEVSAAVRRARLHHGVDEPPVVPAARLLRSGDRVRVEATLDLVEGEHLEVAIHTMIDQLALPTTVSYPERCARALAGLARFYLDHAADPPTSRVGRPHVLVLVDLEVLEARTGGSATLASGAVISGDDARRLAEDANVTRIVTRGRSEVLDVGRATRTVPAALAKAVIARDRHCRYAGCTGPPHLCEIHHLEPWASGGATLLENLGLLCWHHHSEVHRRGPQHLHEGPDGRWTLAEREVVSTAASAA